MASMQADIAVVTGASRGVGRGIAVALGRAGMTVYVTGRTLSGQGQEQVNGQVLGGNLEETAALVTAAGGCGIPVRCDHADDAQVVRLFERVEAEQGRLDLLVNNATFLHYQLVSPGPFWEKDLGMVDMLDVGLRSAYVASYYAVPLLLKSPRGLITFISSYGANCYMHGPAYGAQKAGCDKLAADMAVDLEGTQVAALSLWLGLQHTERSALVGAGSGVDYSAFLAQAETPEFNGGVIHALLNDPTLAQLSGQTLITAEQAARYGIVDTEQRRPASMRQQLGGPVPVHPARIG
ncbi:NAD(P)-dependent dehydrogenase, short-chain alcohol dehydrogenase family [Halopseudomonas litoralis]|uniref:NAD(P)-dependent dehydrogenase, short-chain alcohol dehydrogenase family n=1 Tax=Halopseudomonas litoralis TaxID=797277 RepID=A0A1H1LW99_9GAMM|nr:SDR family NAD(P)-dependent oxidoreductase [Halopseudomonas litoralis]SDR78059.1 NAD(P)-dependent dehydrogenase, short-chain alcohol dehydrogenase family [Halopseudomonas litoralis]